MSDVLQDAREAIEKGDKARGRQLLSETLQADPDNASAWVWMSRAVNTAEQRRTCLDRALAINPKSLEAKQALLDWLVAEADAEVLTTDGQLKKPATLTPVESTDSNAPTPTSLPNQIRPVPGMSLKEFRRQLKKNYNILKERQAKYGSTAAPLDLLNQIDDYEQAIALTEEAIDRSAPLEELQADFSSLNLQISTVVFVAQEPPRKPFRGLNPYRGLRKFTEDEAEFYFGRNTAIQSLLDEVQYLVETETSQQVPDLLAVLGPSGSGKSSLVRAGLIPALWAGRLKNSQQWPVKVMLPGPHPLDALAEIFVGEIDRSLADLRAELNGGKKALHYLTVEALANKPKESILVLVIDQFEELFTLCEAEDEQRAFIDQLLYATQVQDNRMLAVLTMRSDFYSKVAVYKPLAEAVTRYQMLVSPMTEKELREAILLPAEAVGLEIEQALVESLLKDTFEAPGVLPLLQHALLELFHRRDGNLLTLEAYNEIGGVEGALAHRADSVINELTPDQQRIARRTFMRLIQLGEGTADTRRRATLSEVLTQTGETQEVETVVNKLADANLLVTSSHPETGEKILDVSHEALIREWPLLRSWMDEDRQGLRIRHQLSQATRDWHERGRDADSLYRGARLLEVEEWVAANPDEINPLEQAFLEASIAARDQAEEERKKRNQRIIAGLATALVLVAIGAVFGFVGQSQARQAEQTAIAERDRAEQELLLSISNELVAQSQTKLDLDPDLSILLALQAIETVDTTQAREMLYRSVQAAHLDQTLTGHTDFVNSVAYAPNGSRLVTTSDDGTVRVWEVETGQELLSLSGHEGTVWRAVFSPDGATIATAGADGTARLWDAASGQELLVLPHADVVSTVAYRPDGKQLATGSVDGSVHIWDTDSDQAAGSFQAHDGMVTELAYSPDGTRIATASDEATVRVWDATSGEELLVLTGHANEVNSVAFHPGGALLATAGSDGTVRLWDAETGEEVAKLSGHVGSVWSVVYSRDGSRLTSAGEDGTARVWEATFGVPLLELTGHTADVAGVVFSPDGRHLATAGADGTAKIWRVASHDYFFGHADLVNQVAYSPDGTRLASAGSDRRVRVWDTKTGRELQSLRHDSRVVDVAYNPVSGDGRLASASQDGTVRIWNADSGDELLTLNHADFVNSVAYSPDGTTLASASSDGTARVWEAETGQELLTLPQDDVVIDVVYQPDGTRLATVSQDALVRVWDAETGQLILSFPSNTSFIWSMAYSPDGSRLVTAGDDGITRLWDAESGQPLLILKGHNGAVRATAFGPDGRRLATASDDRTTIVWDAVSGEMLLSLADHKNGVQTVAFSPDGQWLVTGSQDWTIRAHPLNPDELLDWARSRLSRGWTAEECAQFIRLGECPVAP